MAKVLRRPRKEMMLAVNASVDGKTADLNKLIKEYKLSRAELGKRLELRDGEKYDLKRKGGRPKGSGNKVGKRGPGRPRKAGRGPGRPPGRPAGRTQKAAGDLLSLMDGRTNTVTLLKIAYKASELLDARPKPEVARVEKALNDVEELRERYEAAMELIGG